jgi:hypothetical protein
MAELPTIKCRDATFAMRASLVGCAYSEQWASAVRSLYFGCLYQLTTGSVHFQRSLRLPCRRHERQRLLPSRRASKVAAALPTRDHCAGKNLNALAVLVANLRNNWCGGLRLGELTPPSCPCSVAGAGGPAAPARPLTKQAAGHGTARCNRPTHAPCTRGKE